MVLRNWASSYLLKKSASIELTQALLERNLVDELRLVVAPAVQARGRKLFDKGLSGRLTLTRTVASPSGYLLLDYHVRQ